MMKLRLLVALLCLYLPYQAFGATTPITDTVYLADDSTPPLGSYIVVRWPRFTTPGGRSIPAGQKTVALASDGSFTVSLEPTDVSIPAFVYTAEYHVIDAAAAPAHQFLSTFSEYWSVPTSGTPKIIQQLVSNGNLPIVGQVRLIAKGDTVAFDGTNPVRVPVGADGTVQIADSTQPAGIRWGSVGGQVSINPHATGTVDTPVSTALAGRVSALNFSGVDPAGIADSGAGLQAAFNYAYSSHNLYIPCGTYKFGTKISLGSAYTNNVTIEGEARGCVVLQYTGGATDYAVKIGGGGASIKNLTVIGNTNVSVAALGLFLSNSVVSNVAAEDANSLTGAGIEINNGTGDAFYNLIVNTFVSSTPRIGILMDGQTTESSLYNPTVANFVANGVELQVSGNSYNNNVFTAQFDGTTCVDTEDTSSISFYDGLCEQVPQFPGNVLVLNSPNNRFLNMGADLGPVVVNSSGNRFVNGTLNGTLQIAAGANNNSVEGVALHAVSDSGTFTYYRNNKAIGSGGALDSKDIPSRQTPYAYWNPFGTSSDFPVELDGAWGTATANVAIPLSTMKFTPAKAWKAQFIGSWVGFGGTVQANSPGFVELSDTHNALTLSTVTYTFTVDPTSKQFSMATTLNDSGFVGKIIFSPNSSVAAGTGSTASAYFQGAVTMPSVSTAGAISGASISSTGNATIGGTADVTGSIHSAAGAAFGVSPNAAYQLYVVGNTFISPAVGKSFSVGGVNCCGVTAFFTGPTPAAVAGNGTTATETFRIDGAKGGDTTGTTGQSGGTGSQLELYAGNGGNAAAGSTNGNGGLIQIQAGSPGTGGTGGSPGTVYINGNGTGKMLAKGQIDFTTASATSPLQIGSIAGKPATCGTGQMYYATDATAGQNLYGCTATNTWTQQGGSGGGGSTATTTEASRTITASATALTTDSMLYCDATTAAVTVTLPASANGRLFKVKKIDASANACTVTPASGQIEFQASVALTSQGAIAKAGTNGTNWYLQ